MSREKIEKWLNKQIELRQKIECSQELTAKICAVTGVDSKQLHIYKGLDIIADTLGVELITCTREGSQYPIERYFWYGDVKVFSIYHSLEEGANE